MGLCVAAMETCGASHSTNAFLVDNCKSIYFAGHESTAVCVFVPYAPRSLSYLADSIGIIYRLKDSFNLKREYKYPYISFHIENFDETTLIYKWHRLIH